jgi:stage II sporulation protein GA (sporulation sigma-E factor processing peptidase)
MGGIAVSFGRGKGMPLVLSAAMVWLLCRISFGQTVGGKEYVPVRIRSGNREIQVLALRDTGNSLKDPVTGESVLVLGTEPAMKLTGLTRQQLSSPLETMATGLLPGLRLIPYRAVGKGNGMLLAMRFRDVTIGNRRQNTIVAFDPGGLGEEQMYQALTGGV